MWHNIDNLYNISRNTEFFTLFFFQMKILYSFKVLKFVSVEHWQFVVLKMIFVFLEKLVFSTWKAFLCQ